MPITCCCVLFIAAMAVASAYTLLQTASPLQTQVGTGVALAADGAMVAASYESESARGKAYMYMATELAYDVPWPNSTVSELDGSLTRAYDATQALDQHWETKEAAFVSNYSLLLEKAVWTQTAVLQPSDVTDADYFSYSTTLAEGEAVITSYGRDSLAGAAYVFTSSDNGGSWSEQAVLVASDSVANSRFGFSAAFSTFGEISTDSIESGPPSFLGIGATHVDTSKGAVYVFTKNYYSSAWSQQSKLQASDAVAADYFGARVAATPEILVAGATGKSSGAGAAYVFSYALNEVSSTIYTMTWTQEQKLEAPDQLPGDAFGSSLAVSQDNSVIAVGATGDDDLGSNAGAVYLFTNDGSASSSGEYAWSYQAKLYPSDGAAGDSFGHTVSVMTYSTTHAEKDIAVGAYGHDSNRGQVYIFHENVQTSGLVTPIRTWSQSSVLRPYGGGAEQDNFGAGVAFSRDGLNLLTTSHRSDRGGSVHNYYNADAVSSSSFYRPEIETFDYITMSVCQCLAIAIGIFISKRIREARNLSHKTVEDEQSGDQAEGERGTLVGGVDKHGALVHQPQSHTGLETLNEVYDEDKSECESSAAAGAPGARFRPRSSLVRAGFGVVGQDDRGMYAGIGSSEKSDAESSAHPTPRDHALFHPNAELTFADSEDEDKHHLEPEDEIREAHLARVLEEAEEGTGTSMKISTGKFSDQPTSREEGVDTSFYDDTQVQPGSRRNIITFQYRDFLFDVTQGVLTRVVTLCSVYVLYEAGAQSTATGMVAMLTLLHMIPYAIFCIDYAFPKVLGRSVRYGFAPHMLKPRFEFSLPIIIIALGQLEFIRFLPWRQSRTSIISRGFPTIRTFQYCVYSELILDITLFLVSLAAQLSTTSVNGTRLDGLDLDKEDYVVWYWIHILHMLMLSIRILGLLIHVALPVWSREGKKLDLAFENSPTSIPGAAIEYNGEIVDHRHKNARPGEDFQFRDKETGGVRITRVHRGSGKFSLRDGTDESDFDTRLDPVTITALGSSPRTNISRLSNVSDGFYVEEQNSRRWKETTTEQNIESLRRTMEAAAHKKATKDRKKKDSGADDDDDTASYIAHKKARSRNKKGRNGAQLFGRESMKSNNSEQEASPVAPFIGDMGSSGIQFTPRGSGKFSTPGGSGKFSTSNANLNSISMKTDATGRDSFASVKTEVLEGTGYSSPLASPHIRALGPDDEIDAKVNADAKRQSIPSLGDYHDYKRGDLQEENDSDHNHEPASIRKPPRKPPKPKRLLDRHNSRLHTLREDDSKDQDEKYGSEISGLIDKVEQVEDVRNYDSTKSNVSEFPNLPGQRHQSVEAMKEAVDVESPVARMRREALLKQRREEEQAARELAAAAAAKEQRRKEEEERRKQVEEQHERREEKEEEERVKIEAERQRGRKDRDMERRQRDKEKERLLREEARAAEILRQSELEGEVEKERKQQQRARNEARRKDREERRSRRRNRAADRNSEAGQGEKDDENTSALSIGSQLSRSRSLRSLGSRQERGRDRERSRGEGNVMDDDAVSALSIGSQLSRSRSLRGVGGRRRSERGERHDGGDESRSDLSGTTGPLSASIPRLDLALMSPIEGEDAKRLKLELDSVKPRNPTSSPEGDSSASSGSDRVAVNVRTPVSVRTVRGRKK